MIRLFRLDGLEIMLNVDAIKEIRGGPPTTVSLVNGERLQVKNTPVDVMTKIRAERKGREDEERQAFSSFRPPPAAVEKPGRRDPGEAEN